MRGKKPSKGNASNAIGSRPTLILLCIILAAFLVPMGTSNQEAQAATGELLLCSSDSSGNIANAYSGSGSINSTGRYVAFSSYGSNLVPGDSNGTIDTFWKDINTGQVLRCSTDSSGNQANLESTGSSISSDGRYVGFYSRANNLVTGDTNGQSDIFRKDLVTGETARCSTDSSGNQSNGTSSYVRLSSDGRYVAFQSDASNLVVGDNNGKTDVFRKDLVSGETLCCSMDSLNQIGNNASMYMSINSDGRYVAFQSDTSNLVAGDNNLKTDIFRKDLVTGEILRCSTNLANQEGNNISTFPSISMDGRFVAFDSTSSNLVTGDNNNSSDIFRKDLITGAIVRCSTDASGAEKSGHSTYASINADGRYIAFKSDAWLMPNYEYTGYSRIYRKDLVTGEILYCSCTTTSGIISGTLGPPEQNSDGNYAIFTSDTQVYRKLLIGEPPYVDSLSPGHGFIGTEVTISGGFFGSAQGGSYVSFGLVKATQYTSWSDTQIKCMVPSGAFAMVDLTVTTSIGTSSVVSFAISPKVDFIDPEAAPLGTAITINGSAFGPSQENSYVDFNGTKVAEYLSWSENIIKLKVPRGISGQVNVRVNVVFKNGRFGSEPVIFTVVPFGVAFAEGYTGSGFQEFLCIGNPQNYNAKVDIYYLFTNGKYADDSIVVPANCRTTVNVNDFIAQYFEEGAEVSAIIYSDLEVVVERPMYFNYNGRWTGGHDVIGTPYASDMWFFAEGYTGPGFDEWVCVLNPNENAANLKFHFMVQGAGEFIRTASVPALSRRSFKVNDLLGANYSCSLALESDQYVAAERSMYFDYLGTGMRHWEGGHCVMGLPYLSTEYYFAEGTTRSGFEEWLTLQNPNPESITIIANYQLGPGQGDPVQVSHVIPPLSRDTVYVANDVGTEKDVSVKLSSSAYFLAERPMYFRYTGYGANWEGGHCVIGAVEPSNELFFAEGYTGSGFQEWLCLQNPGDQDSTVEVSYLGNGGSAGVKPVIVPARSRKTLRVNDEAGPNLELSCRLRVTSGPAIVAERPMYFLFRGWDGGHDVVGYAPIDFSSSASSQYQSAGLGQCALIRDLSLDPSRER